MKMIVSDGTKKLDLNLNFIENRPLVVVDDKLYQDTVIVTDAEIKTGFVAGTKLTYTLKNKDENNTVVNLGTIPNYYTKGKLDLLYIPSESILALVPNMEDMLAIEAGVIEANATSIGGFYGSDACAPNISFKHTDKANIILGEDFTGLELAVNVNTIFGCIRSNEANPIMQTTYLANTVGEIMVGGAMAVMNVLLTIDNGVSPVPAFNKSIYPASVLYHYDIDKLRLKHIENLPKAKKYMIVLG